MLTAQAMNMRGRNKYCSFFHLNCLEKCFLDNNLQPHGHENVLFGNLCNLVVYIEECRLHKFY